MDHEQLTRRIIGFAMKVHRVLGPGFLESVYQKALVHDLSGAGLTVEQGRRVQVLYEGILVGDFCVDMLVDGSVLLENKAVRGITPAHEAQLVNYLTATGIDTGLLLNFGTDRLQIRRKARTYRPRPARLDEHVLPLKKTDRNEQEKTG